MLSMLLVASPSLLSQLGRGAAMLEKEMERREQAKAMQDLKPEDKKAKDRDLWKQWLSSYRLANLNKNSTIPRKSLAFFGIHVHRHPVENCADFLLSAWSPSTKIVIVSLSIIAFLRSRLKSDAENVLCMEKVHIYSNIPFTYVDEDAQMPNMSEKNDRNSCFSSCLFFVLLPSSVKNALK